MNRPIKKYDKSKGDSSYQYFNFVFSFGITMAITLFLTYHGGTWLDRRLGTAPWCMLVLVILGLVASIRVLIRDLNNLNKEYGGRGNQRKKNGSDQH